MGHISVSLASFIPQACDLHHGLFPIKGTYAWEYYPSWNGIAFAACGSEPGKFQRK